VPEFPRFSIDPSGRPDRQKTWRVGTLVYTSGGLAALFFWLLGGDFAWNLKERAVSPVAQLMLRSLDASDLVVGLLIGSLPAALGMIIGPIVSVKSDQHRGRWGRRIPFLLITAPFIVLSMMALGFTPMLADELDAALGADSPGRAVLGIGIFVVFWFIFEVFSVVANVIFGALINDVVPDALIGRFFGLFRAVGLIAGIVFNYMLMGHAESHYLEIFIGVGLIYGLGFVIMCLRVKEGEYPPPPVKQHSEDLLKPTKVYFRECYSNPYYRWLFLAATFGMLANAPVNTFSVFYAKSLGMEMSLYGKCVALTYVFSIFLTYPLGALADRLHPLRLGFLFTVIYCVAMIAAGFTANNAEAFMVFFVAHGVLSGSYMTATASLGQRLYPKLKFAQFASAWGLMFGVGYILTTPLMGLFLDWAGHQYQYTFFASGLLAALGVIAFVVAYKYFLRLGGHHSYVPPEPFSEPNT
jgi:MFS family permease